MILYVKYKIKSLLLTANDRLVPIFLPSETLLTIKKTMENKNDWRCP
jgi:hypothetical protein